MASGKFSQPRPYRDEERQIEQAFRQVTGQAPKQPLDDPAPDILVPPQVPQMEDPLMEETLLQITGQDSPAPVEPRQEDAQIEQAFRQLTGQEPGSSQGPKPRRFERLAENMTAFFDEEIPQEPDNFQEEKEEPDTVDKLMAWWNELVDYCGKNQKIVLVLLCTLALVMIGSFIGILVSSTADPFGGKILDKVSIIGVQVGGMDQKQAAKAVQQVADNLYAQDMVINLSGQELRLSARDTKVKLDVKAAVKAAYDFGRSGTQAENEQAYLLSLREGYPVPLTAAMLSMNDKYIRQTLEAYAKEAGSTLTQTTYGLEGQQPQLSADKFDEKAPTQTLVITLGTPGIGFDADDVYRQVKEAYALPSFLVTVENVDTTKEPEDIDLRAIYEEFHIDPVEATIDDRTNQPIPGAYGYTFDLEKAMELLAQASYGEELRIPMEYVAPELLDADSFYKDTLGEHRTRHTSDDSRNTNLRLATQAIHGSVVKPGEKFSFNTAVGQRTSGNGYKTAPADSTPYAMETPVLGGGVSQVASTLYQAALVADLDIVSRTAGRYAPGFTEFGMDAEVSNSTDLVLRNNHSYPIRIDAQVSGGYVKIQIIGTETRDDYVMMEQSISRTIQPEVKFEEFPHVNAEGYLDGDVIQEGITGYSVKTYKVRYDRQSGSQQTKELAASTEYQARPELIARVEPEETTVPTTAPTVPPTSAPTVPPTTAPTQPPATQSPTEATQAPTTVPTTAPTQPVTEATQAATEAAVTQASEPPASTVTADETQAAA